jgi:hypothetical protein
VLDARIPRVVDPAEEDVARRLGEPLAADDPLSVMRMHARAGSGLEHRFLRLLELEEQGIFLARPDHHGL